jgi:hypothetical protein
MCRPSLKIVRRPPPPPYTFSPKTTLEGQLKDDCTYLLQRVQYQADFIRRHRDEWWRFVGRELDQFRGWLMHLLVAVASLVAGCDPPPNPSHELQASIDTQMEQMVRFAAVRKIW